MKDDDKPEWPKEFTKRFWNLYQPNIKDKSFVSCSLDVMQYIEKLLDEQRKETLNNYSNFLEKNGYLDSDWREEEPTAIDKFLALNE
jgi:hypothetical protein